MPDPFLKIINDGGVFIIAEIGKNFIQKKEKESVATYLENAKRLIDDASEAGVDAVKFQTHEVEDEQMDIPVISPHFSGSDRYSWVKRNTEATPFSFFEELKEYSEQKGLIFFSTPMSRKAAEKLEKLNVPLWKIGSGDVLDYVMLDYITKTKKPIIISTGMVSFKELDDVVSYIKKRDCPLSILYCVSKYPCPREEFNLGTIEYLKEKYPDLVIGFSDHSVGDNTIPLKAIKVGARIIEKHFSISRDLWGSDHKVSMTKNEMKELVNSVRNKEYEDIDISGFYGKKDKELEGAENKFRPYFNKSLVAGVEIKKDDTIQEHMVYAMRPCMHIDGLPSEKFHTILNKKVKRDLKKYEPINYSDLE